MKLIFPRRYFYVFQAFNNPEIMALKQCRDNELKLEPRKASNWYSEPTLIGASFMQSISPYSHAVNPTPTLLCYYSQRLRPTNVNAIVDLDVNHNFTKFDLFRLDLMFIFRTILFLVM